MITSITLALSACGGGSAPEVTPSVHVPVSTASTTTPVAFD